MRSIPESTETGCRPHRRVSSGFQFASTFITSFIQADKFVKQEGSAIDGGLDGFGCSSIAH